MPRLSAVRMLILYVGWIAPLLSVSPPSGLGAEPAVRVGAAAASMEADDSMVIAGGIGPRLVKGQEGQLRATAVVIEKSGGPRVAIVGCDVLFTPRDIVDAALAEIQATTGIPSSHVLVSATHTHSAPSVTRVHGYDCDAVFAQRLQRAIVESVQRANAQRETGAAEFLFHLGEENTVGDNSRQLLADGMIWWIGPRDNVVGPTGPFDPQLPVLGFRRPDGSWQAIIYNHSTHTIGARSGNVRSPSFYGLAAQELEVELGTTVCFLEGASGSTHNIHGVSTAEAVIRMKRAVQDALQQATVRPIGKLASIKRPFTFKVRTFDEHAEDAKVVSYCQKYAPAAWEQIAQVFRDMRSELAPHQGQPRETWLQAISLGDVAVVGVPAEYFTGLGVDIKTRSPFQHTVIAELANDWIGYLPDREGHRLGGYQTWMGLHSYAEEGTGERVADEVVAMLRELSQGSP